MMEALTTDCMNSLSTLGDYGDEVAIALYEEIERLKNENKPLPIESAPKDGAVIDVWVNKERITNVHWNEQHKAWRDNDGDYFDDATHWIPMPIIED